MKTRLPAEFTASLGFDLSNATSAAELNDIVLSLIVKLLKLGFVTVWTWVCKSVLIAVTTSASVLLAPDHVVSKATFADKVLLEDNDFILFTAAKSFALNSLTATTSSLETTNGFARLISTNAERLS